MKSFYTLTLPFGNIEFTTLPHIVDNVDQLPHYVMTLQYKNRESAKAVSGMPAEMEFHFGLKFDGLDRSILKTDGVSTGAFNISEAALDLIEEGIQYALSQKDTRKLIRKEVNQEQTIAGLEYVAERLKSSQRQALMMAIYVALTKQSNQIFLVHDPEENFFEKLVIDLGNGVKLITRPLFEAAPSASDRTFRGTIVVSGIKHNFYITRHRSMPFKKHMTYDTVQDAYSYVWDKLQAIAAFKALDLPPLLSFVDDSVELESTFVKE